MEKIDVFPTPVGMVLHRPRGRLRADRFPHARGDGPTITSTTKPGKLFSPRPWGWSMYAQYVLLVNEVFPTPVGMVRRKT